MPTIVVGKEANNMEAREQEIRELAYCLWEAAGCPSGQDLEYWHKAEAAWDEQNARSAASAVKAARPRRRSAARKATKSKPRKTV